MGSGLSRAQLAEYKELVKDRLSDEAISFLHMRFMQAAPSGSMTPDLFRKYIESTGVYKNKRITERERRLDAEIAREGPAGPYGSVEVASWTPTGWFGSSNKKVKTVAEAAQSTDSDSDDNKKPRMAGSTAVLAEQEQGSGEETYMHLFRGYDLDGDGVITFKEFLIYHLAVVYSTEELFYVVFNTYDEDQDGLLSLGDLKSVMTASTRYVGDVDVRDREVQRVIDEEARRLMAFLDIRKQGRIQRDDMRLIVQKYPQVLEKMKSLM